MKKIITLVLALFMVSTIAMSGSLPTYKNNYPQYPGGTESLQKYIVNNTNYKAEGTVVVEFTVTKEGNVENARIIESDNIALNKETLKTISKLNFEPGNINGRNVDVSLRLPIKVTLV